MISYIFYNHKIGLIIRIALKLQRIFEIFNQILKSMNVKLVVLVKIIFLLVTIRYLKSQFFCTCEFFNFMNVILNTLLFQLKIIEEISITNFNVVLSYMSRNENLSYQPICISALRRMF